MPLICRKRRTRFRRNGFFKWHLSLFFFMYTVELRMFAPLKFLPDIRNPLILSIIQCNWNFLHTNPFFSFHIFITNCFKRHIWKSSKILVIIYYFLEREKVPMNESLERIFFSQNFQWLVSWKQGHEPFIFFSAYLITFIYIHFCTINLKMF